MIDFCAAEQKNAFLHSFSISLSFYPSPSPAPPLLLLYRDCSTTFNLWLFTSVLDGVITQESIKARLLRQLELPHQRLWALSQLADSGTVDNRERPWSKIGQFMFTHSSQLFLMRRQRWMSFCPHRRSWVQLVDMDKSTADWSKFLASCWLLLKISIFIGFKYVCLWYLWHKERIKGYLHEQFASAKLDFSTISLGLILLKSLSNAILLDRYFYRNCTTMQCVSGDWEHSFS